MPVCVACAYLAWHERPEGLTCVSGLSHDCGAVGQGEELEVTFVLRNDFKEPIGITGIKRSCSCSETSISKDKLARGEKATVRAVWQVGASRGQVSTQLWVMYVRPDGKTSAVPLETSADVEPDVLVEPSELHFEGSKDATASARVRPGRLAEGKVVRVFTSNPAFVAEYRSATGEVAVSFRRASWRTDNQNEPLSLSIVTNSEKEPVLEVPIIFDGE